MDTLQSSMPEEGIDLDHHHHLFLVDIRGLFKPSQKPQRRAFVDLQAAIRFIDGRAATLSAFLSPLNQSADAAMYGLVEEAFESTMSKTYMLRFSGTPSVVLTCTPSTHDGAFEPYRRVYPTAGADV
ncbi:hypothetical protein [Paucibacter sp. M5-1]|uniref:hypothetical protein n=1 Tax=Paucibacter sp. M5-1 TaxID=3015998 RepID=UPI0022B8C286|nr:hypothetical protein [Paucibacter sp. M5-1]MCZ7884633.1 hypothetical protein [Paucibacter sp. M5-1]